MDLIIVDRDCHSFWSMSELEHLLNTKSDKIWFIDEDILRENNFNLYAAAQVPYGVTIEKGILLTKMQSGIMRYHREMLLNTLYCKYWMIVILDVNGTAYKKQYCTRFDSILSESSIQYEVIFDHSDTLDEVSKTKRDVFDKHPYCIIATKTDQQLAEHVRSILDVHKEEWYFECHVGWEEDSYKYADKILLVGRTEKDYQVPATLINTNRVRIWIDLQKESISDKIIQEKKNSILDKINECGWNLGKYKSKILGSCLDYEILLTELMKNEISMETLRTDERFIMWDLYGLPLPEKDYHDTEKMELFLKRQCCLLHIF